MTLWWIGNLILVGVVIPVVVGILFQVLVPIFQIRKYVDDIMEHGALFAPHLEEAAGELVKTRDLVRAAGPLIGRYVGAAERL